MIAADGTVEQQTGIFESAVLTTTLGLGDAGTVATRVGGSVEVSLGALGGLSLAWALLFRGHGPPHRSGVRRTD